MPDPLLELQVKTLLNELADVDPTTTTTSALLAEDLGVDSLTHVELLGRLEGQFGVVFPDDEVEGLRTIGLIAERIESLRE